MKPPIHGHAPCTIHEQRIGIMKDISMKQHIRMKNIWFVTAFLMTVLIAGCSRKSDTGTVTDIDGNTYGTVKIGNHVWMSENLKVSRYRNGDPLPEITDAAEWPKQTGGARCAYENKLENGKSFGYLYNWFSVSDPRGIAPEGWHIATDAEWADLAEALGGEKEAGKALKAPGKWGEPVCEECRNSGFNALASGARRDSDGSFLVLGQFARFWTSTPASNGTAFVRALSFYDGALRGGEAGPKNGFAIRCVKD